MVSMFVDANSFIPVLGRGKRPKDPEQMRALPLAAATDSGDDVGPSSRLHQKRARKPKSLQLLALTIRLEFLLSKIFFPRSSCGENFKYCNAVVFMYNNRFQGRLFGRSVQRYGLQLTQQQSSF